MPALSYTKIASVCEELKTGLINSHLQEIYQPDRETLYLLFWSPPEPKLLYVSIQPQEMRVHLALNRRPNPQKPLAFQMFLRKHIKSAHLANIAVHPEDQRVVFYLRAPHDNHRYYLLVEFFQTSGRLVLLNKSCKVLRVMGNLNLGGSKLKSGIVYEHLKEWICGIENLIPPFMPNHPPERKQAEYPLNLELASELQTEGSTETHESDLRKQIAAKIKKLARTISKVETDLKKAEKSVSEADSAEWLKHYMHTIKRGMEKVKIETHEGIMEIELDPALSPQENINKIFNRARRLGKRLEEIQSRLKQLILDKEALEKVLLFEGAEFLEKASEIIITTRKKQTLKRTARQPAHTPYREFKSSAGMKILVGKGGKDNHELTFKVAAASDFWLHVKGFSGSHTILVCPKRVKPDEKSINEAARLAAYYSKAPDGERVEIAFVKRSFVKPVKGTVGKVTFINERTLTVNKSDKIITDLNKTE